MGRAEALRSLHGLSVGDAVGQAWMYAHAGLPKEPRLHGWRWTDDTHMALSVFETLNRHGQIEPDALAASFAQRYWDEPRRGYAGAAAALLRQLHAGEDWRVAAPAMFEGAGSFGNGAAMRAAPIGAWFAGDPERAAAEADASAEVTHAHVDGRAGAVAVAVAAALLAGPAPPRRTALLRATLEHVPASRVREGLAAASELPADDINRAARELGTGTEVTAHDTVPFALWVAAHASGFEDALLRASIFAGDTDTLGAIAGGLVVLDRPKIPRLWELAREPLPDGFEVAASEA